MKQDLSKNFDNPIRILAFNRFKRLIAVFASYNECERITGLKHSMVQRACKGITVACKKYYFRELKDDVAIEDSDLNNLTLFEYDKEVLHEDRKVFQNGQMKHPAVLESKMKSLNVYQ